MKGKQVVLGHIGKTKVAALLVDGIVQDVLVEDLNRLPLGSLLRAVVDRPVKGIGGVILRLPNGTGFLKKAKGIGPRSDPHGANFRFCRRGQSRSGHSKNFI
jgi:hypothetical protein